MSSKIEHHFGGVIPLLSIKYWPQNIEVDFHQLNSNVYSPGAGGTSIYSKIQEAVPALKSYIASCPGTNCNTTIVLGTLIQHINDIHKWTRERIADWLETLDVDLTVRPVSKVESFPLHFQKESLNDAAIYSNYFNGQSIDKVIADDGVIFYGGTIT